MKRIITMCLITMLMLSIALAVYGDNQSVTVKYSIADACSLTKVFNSRCLFINDSRSDTYECFWWKLYDDMLKEQ